MKRFLSVLFATVSLAVANPLYASGSGAFELSWPVDLSLSLPAGAAFAAGQLLPEPETGMAFGWLDDTWTQEYDPAVARLSDITSLAGVFVLPFLLENWDVESIGTVAVMYGEAFALGTGSKDLLKNVTRRPRPYVDSPNDLAKSLDAQDRYVSFPSGHTTIAFVTAGFATTVVWQGKDPDWQKWGITAGVYSLAAMTAWFRVDSGEHHWTDVLAGALLGTLIGVAIPLAHTR